VAVLLLFTLTRNTTDYDRGEWVLVLKAYIVFADDREYMEEILTIDANDILFSLNAPGDMYTTRSYLCITRRYLYYSLMLGSDTRIVVILT